MESLPPGSLKKWKYKGENGMKTKKVELTPQQAGDIYTALRNEIYRLQTTEAADRVVRREIIKGLQEAARIIKTAM